jgi:hypothetical protein
MTSLKTIIATSAHQLDFLVIVLPGQEKHTLSTIHPIIHQVFLSPTSVNRKQHTICQGPVLAGGWRKKDITAHTVH